MKDILTNYVDREIGMNLEKPFHIDSVTLVAVEDDHFTVQDHKHGYLHHFGYPSVVQIIEHAEGVDIGGLFRHHKLHPLVVKVGHLTAYVPA